MRPWDDIPSCGHVRGWTCSRHWAGTSTPRRTRCGMGQVWKSHSHSFRGAFRPRLIRKVPTAAIAPTANGSSAGTFEKEEAQQREHSGGSGAAPQRDGVTGLLSPDCTTDRRRCRVFATARKLATIIYRLLRWGQPYLDEGAEQRYRENRIKSLTAGPKNSAINSRRQPRNHPPARNCGVDLLSRLGRSLSSRFAWPDR